MSNRTSKGKIPKFRFPEFQKGPRWKKERLVSVASKDVKWSFTGGPFGSNLKASDYTETGVRIVQLQNIGDAEFLDGYKICTSEAKADELLSCNIFPGEIILSKMGDPVARACIVPATQERFVMCSDGIRLVVDEDRFNKFFVYSSINSAQFREQAKIASTGSTRRRIGIDDLKDLLLFVPQIGEQKKVADCLSALDDLIAAQAKKVEALKSYKKGLMQQLFPAEGETVPRLRFPEFREVGEWKERKAGTLFANRIEEGEAGLPIYAVTMNDGMVKRSSLDREFDDIAEPNGNKKAYRSDIAYNMMRMWQGASGVAVEDCMVSPAYVVLAPREGVHSTFFGYLLKLPRYLRMLASHSQGLTLDRLRLYYKDFASIPLPHPPVPEQKKIAGCLSALDNLIVINAQKLEALKAHKKGLMQGLFPSMTEGEG